MNTGKVAMAFGLLGGVFFLAALIHLFFLSPKQTPPSDRSLDSARRPSQGPLVSGQQGEPRPIQAKSEPETGFLAAMAGQGPVPDLILKNRAKIQAMEAAGDLSPQGIRKRPLSEWKAIAEDLAKDLTFEQRRSLAQALRQAFAPGQAQVNGMSHADIRDLALALDLLDQGQSAILLSEWFAPSGGWPDAPGEILALLALKAAEADQTTLLSGKTILNPEILERLSKAMDSKGFCSSSALCDFARAWLVLGEERKSEAWTRKAWSRLMADPGVTVGEVVKAGRLAGELGLKEMDGAGFSVLLERWMVEGRLSWDFEEAGVLAWPLFRSPEARQRIERAFLDGGNRPRMVAAKVLAKAYGHAGQSGAWRGRLEEGLKGAKAEERVGWLMAKAYSEGLAFQDSPAQPVQRLFWLNKALGEARTGEDRWVVANELASCHLGAGRPDLAFEVVEKVKEGLSGVLEAEAEGRRVELRRRMEESRVWHFREQFRAAEVRAGVASRTGVPARHGERGYGTD